MKVLAGDFGKDKQAAFNKYSGILAIMTGFFSADKYSVGDIKQLDEIDEENKASIAGKLGWGAAGAALLGPVGLLAGALAGGNKHNVTFAVEFKDGKKALIECKSKEFAALRAAMF